MLPIMHLLLVINFDHNIWVYVEIVHILDIVSCMLCHIWQL